jgi:hypothetical protein
MALPNVVFEGICTVVIAKEIRLNYAFCAQYIAFCLICQHIFGFFVQTISQKPNFYLTE